MAEQETFPTWGYNEDGGKIFNLKKGEKLPKGYVSHPALVPGSEAERKHKEDAEREGAEVRLG